ncbi:MAG TPA: MFS transporter, partial [Thermomicrobiales bacterium]|nr:MFS transporter [Thermomicrobiales bacterium]
MSNQTDPSVTPTGMAAVPAAVGDVIRGTVEDVKGLPQAASAVAAFPSKATLLPLLLAQFLNSYDSSSMNVAISEIAADLNTTATGVQTALAFYTLVMAAGMIVGSKLSDIIGRRRAFTIGVIIYGVGALITAFAPSIGVMFLGWSILEGIGSCLMIPPIYILVTVNYTDLKMRAAAFGAVSAAAGLGGASGPLIGGIITTAVSWRLSFALEALVVILIVMMRGRIVDAGVAKKKPKLDIPGAILSGVGMIGLVGGLLLAGNYGWFTARQDFSVAGNVLLEEGQISPTIVAFVLGLLFLIGFGLFEGYMERSGKEPLVRMHVILNRVAAAGLTTQAAQWLLSVGIIFIVSLFLQVTFGYNAIETGLMLIPAIIGMLFFSRRSEKLARKYPPKG